MANRTIYTRVYSKSSVGQFVCAKAPKGDPLSDTALLEEFRNHANEDNREPTALVSGSDRIVDTLKRAFDKHYKKCESSAEIWIAFIEIPPTTNETATRIHSAKELAEKCELPEPNLLFHEVVFEWAIPDKYLLHEVSLQTLMKRELQEHCFLQPSTAEARCYIARELQRHGPWEIGVTLGSFARKFGAGAPLNWVSHQLFHDCVWAKMMDDDTVRLNYEHGHTEIVDFQFFCDLDDGIDTSLCDWWLSDIDFFLDYEEFKQWREVIEDSMTWDLIEFRETWHDVDYDGTIKELSAKEKLSYDVEKNKLLIEHEKKRAAIEAEAVKIGL
ncbi:MAG: hypothetical protein Q9215_004064 [Flavoplaca cf. flavocitrina]